MKTVGERLVEALAARGVEVVFGIPGVHTVELYRGLAGAPIRHVTPRHEQGAAFMADGYARVRGKPGVAFVITGPGLTNALTAMAQAKADSIPMLVISGVNRRPSLGKGLGLLHELPDQSAMVRALCPSRTLMQPEDLGAVVDWAFDCLTSGRPGPVHIEIPTDVMALPCPAVAPLASLPLQPLPDLGPALQVMTKCRAPVVLAGGGTRHCADKLRALAETWDAPVIQTVNARGSMHGHSLVVPASPSLDSVRDLIRQSDCILAVGTELGPTDYDMYVRGGFPDLSGMIRIDICPDQLARHPAAIRIAADAGRVLGELAESLPVQARRGAERAGSTRSAARTEVEALLPPVQLAIVEAIRAAVPRAIIVGDSTQPIYAANLYYDHDRAGGWFNAATGFGALGFAPGAAVGAAIAADGEEVVCLIGDGGLQFSPGELRTAVDEALPITFVIWNNAGFREIAEAMSAAGTEVIGCDPSPLRMGPFAQASDLPFDSVSPSIESLTAALIRTSKGPRMIEIRVP